MADDVESIHADNTLAAGRLCNFGTGQARLSPSHTRWLDAEVIPGLRNSPNPWVDVFGYASRLGAD